MTIQVEVKNSDSRESSIIQVSMVSENGAIIGTTALLKGGPNGTGQKIELYVYQGCNLVVKEISQ